MLAALIVAVLGVMTAIGWTLPAEYRTARETGFPHGVDTLCAGLSDSPTLPTWLPGVRAVQRLDAVDGRERWPYDTAEGEMTIEVVTRSAPTEFVIRSVRTDRAFGGTWTDSMSPTPTRFDAARDTLR